MEIKFFVTGNIGYYALVLKELKEGEVEVFEKKLVNNFFWIALGPLQQQDDGPNYEHNGVKTILNSQLILVFSISFSRKVCTFQDSSIE